MSRGLRTSSYCATNDDPEVDTRGATNATFGSTKCPLSSRNCAAVTCTSSSTKATKGVVTRRTPALRAAPGPEFTSSLVSSAPSMLTGAGDASSTTTTRSGASARTKCCTRTVAAESRACTGMTTVIWPSGTATPGTGCTAPAATRRSTSGDSPATPSDSMASTIEAPFSVRRKNVPGAPATSPLPFRERHQ